MPLLHSTWDIDFRSFTVYPDSYPMFFRIVPSHCGCTRLRVHRLTNSANKEFLNLVINWTGNMRSEFQLCRPTHYAHADESAISILLFTDSDYERPGLICVQNSSKVGPSPYIPCDLVVDWLKRSLVTLTLQVRASPRRLATIASPSLTISQRHR